MYTQCPDCGTSFRVTAVVLKQAAGKVRCGGCGNAFNALAYLSENKPDPSVRTEVDGSLPELMPDPIEKEPGSPPTAISPEQSAALLKTLDQLAGEDIRLEDTGIEWRVLGVDEEDESDIDELRENAPIRVDEFLTKTPTPVEAGEIFEDPVPSVVEEKEVFETTGDAADETSAEELRFDDNTGLPDDFDFDSVPSAPAGPKHDPEPMPDPEPENLQVDLALGDPEEWGDLLDEFGSEQSTDAASFAVETEPVPDVDEAAVIEVSGNEDAPLDIDTQFGMQAEAMGIDLSGIHEKPDDDTADAGGFNVAEEDTSIDEDLIAAAFENEQTAVEGDLAEEAEEHEEEGDKELFEEFEEERRDEDLAQELDGKFDEDVENIEIKLEDEERPKHFVPPQSEEEQTINMMIDEELFSMAVEDEDGFASTIVIEDKKVEEKGLGEKDETEKKAPPKEEGSGFETIIMEGELIHATAEQEKLAAAAKATDGLGDAGFVLPKEEPKEDVAKNAPNFRMIAGIVVLALLLVGQLIHQSRSALATVPAINNAIAPVYRAVGAPITPNWDVTGWRIEVTKGSTNPIASFVKGETAESGETVADEFDATAGISAEEDETLTIYSRIGNKSDGPLPYPLISVALTDRFEEIIGNKVLEPSEYLTGNFDPRVPLPPGNTFNALISIESPAPETTGFRLDICYRQAAGLLRCATEDFK